MPLAGFIPKIPFISGQLRTMLPEGIVLVRLKKNLWLKLSGQAQQEWFGGGPRPNFLDHQEGVINGRQSWNRQGHAGGEPLHSSRRQGADHALLLLKGPAARVENP
jgi:hypothetical protein